MDNETFTRPSQVDENYLLVILGNFDWSTQEKNTHFTVIFRRKKRLVRSHPAEAGLSYCLEDPVDPVHGLGTEVSDQC